MTQNFNKISVNQITLKNSKYQENFSKRDLKIKNINENVENLSRNPEKKSANRKTLES